MSVRAIERNHGVGRRTIMKAMLSAWPGPRKELPPRPSRLDPFEPVVDEILKADRPPGGNGMMVGVRGPCS
jgi:hypothetical protein